MPGKEGRFVNSIRETLIGVALTKLWEWVIPLSLTIAPAVTGLVFDPGIPWTYVVTCMAITFSASMVGLLAFRIWRFTKTPEHKIKVLNHQILWEAEKTKAGEVIGLRTVRTQINFQNTAIFPISLIVDEYECSFEGRIPRSKTNRGRAWNIQAQGEGYFRDAMIDMGGLPTKNLQGILRYRIRYGAPGREKYVIEDNLILFAVYNPHELTYLLQVSVNTPLESLSA